MFLGAEVGVEVAGAVCGPSGQGGGHSGLLEAPGTRWRSLNGLARSEEGGVDVGRFLGSFCARCLWWFVEAVGGLGLKRGLGREGGGLVSWVVRSGRLLMTVVLERQGGRLLCEVKRSSLFGGGSGRFFWVVSGCGRCTRKQEHSGLLGVERTLLFLGGNLGFVLPLSLHFLSVKVRGSLGLLLPLAGHGGSGLGRG